ncbi:MAG TPA: TIM barrel protein [Bryobacteraceae bacterium]|nr:TIM barrel protein [Bryobacteraceae bacterium]
MNRRAFLSTTLMAAAAARAVRAALPRIKLSLSGRISEPIGDVPNLKPLTYDEFLHIAKNTGYDAICIRPLQCNISTPLEQMVEMARKTRETGLKVSMVTCDNDQPPNNDCAPFALLNITPRLNMAEIFGTKLIRCQIKRPEQLGWAQRACDEAKERGLWITHLSHPDTLFGNVEDAIDCLKRINRPNFGLTYEPVNWMYNPKGYGREVIKSVAPWIINVYAQNQKVQAATPVNGFPPAIGNPEQASIETCLITTGRRLPAVQRGSAAPATGGAAYNLALWEPGGINFDTVFQGLHEIGYTGYFTVHSRTSQANPPLDLATKSFAFLKPYSDGVKG